MQPFIFKLYGAKRYSEPMMNWLLGAIMGYIIHDAVQPTKVGEVLDKVSLPSNLFVGDN